MNKEQKESMADISIHASGLSRECSQLGCYHNDNGQCNASNIILVDCAKQYVYDEEKQTKNYN